MDFYSDLSGNSCSDGTTQSRDPDKTGKCEMIIKGYNDNTPAGSPVTAQPATTTRPPAVTAPVPAQRLFVLLDTPTKEIADHRADGWVVIEALVDHSDPAAEARRLGCSHFSQGGVIKNV